MHVRTYPPAQPRVQPSVRNPRFQGFEAGIACAFLAGAGAVAVALWAASGGVLPVAAGAMESLTGRPHLSNELSAPALAWVALLGTSASLWRRFARPPNASDAADTGSTRDLEQSERAQRWHQAMLSHTDGIVLLRAVRGDDGHIDDFEVVDANHSAEALLTGAGQQLAGLRLRAAWPADVGDRLVIAYGLALTTAVPLVEELRVRRYLPTTTWLYHQAVATGDGVTITLRDISDRKQAELQLRRATETDELTGLSNRRGFMMLAEQQLRVARRQRKDAILLYIDMDNFKSMNDRFGHGEGDRALAAVGRLLRHTVRDSDVVARLGGDEFTIMALDTDRVGARLIQQRIERQIDQLNASGELAAPISLTVGYTRIRPTDAAPLTEFLARADGLLYARKKRRPLVATFMQPTSQTPRTRSSHLGSQLPHLHNTRFTGHSGRVPI